MEKTLQVIEEMILAAIALQTGRAKDRERAVRLFEKLKNMEGGADEK